MHKGTLEFLSDLFQGDYYWFTESWHMDLLSPEMAMERLDRIAKARVGLLAKNVRIIRLKAPKASTKTVNYGGSGGEFAHPADRITTRRAGGRVSKQDLCGVPKEIFARASGITISGRAALSKFNTLLRECQVVQQRKGQRPEPTGELTISRLVVSRLGRLKKATKADLIRLLGKEEAQKAWDERKAFREEDKARSRAI